MLEVAADLAPGGVQVFALVERNKSGPKAVEHDVDTEAM